MDVDKVLADARNEIESYHKEMCNFKDYTDLKDVLRKLSGYTARAAYMRNSFIRSQQNKVIRFRIDELDPFLAEADRQFKIFSRLGSLIESEWQMSVKGH